MSRRSSVLVTLCAVLALCSCDLVDPMRATPQPDAETFGNLLEAAQDSTQAETWIAKIRVGVPRALGRADDARPTPNVAAGITAVVKVTGDTVVIVDDRPVALMDISPGTELVAIPVAGTMSMHGESELRLTAEQLMDFPTYARWRMPKLDLAAEASALVEDPALVNTAGIETAPIPMGGGNALYFSARLRPPELAGGPWIGARREGLDVPTEGGRSFDRSYRTEIGDDGWTAPQRIEFPGIGADRHAKVTWVSADELSCYVTVSGADDEPWVGVSRRPTTAAGWGEPVKLEATGGGDAFDAVAMTGSPEITVFASTRTGGGDIYLHDPAAGQAGPLQPEINSGGLEWSPRVGPDDELYFLRNDRQLLFRMGSVTEVRLPGPHRSLLTEAAPTADGKWLFFAVPRFRPVELDYDIMVAAIHGDGSLGEPVLVDEWRPE